VYAFLYARTGNTALTEDLASQTFVKIAENFHTYRKEKGAVSTWVFTIALNEMRSHFRRLKGKETATLEDIPELAGDENIEVEFLRGETKKELLTLLSQLDERQRSAVTLKYYGELSGREIAHILEISESNVNTILNRATKKLKKLLEQCDKTAIFAYKSQEGKR
jgi:RNA polymerase sigma-70 factor (ECF subfamily)